MSCGYEPAIEGAKRWTHPGNSGEAPSTCVGYLVSLPDVIKISRLRLHWKNGGAASITDERERLLIEELEVNARAAETYSIRKANEEAKQKHGRR